MKSSLTWLVVFIVHIRAAPASQIIPRNTVDPVYGPPGASGNLRPDPELVGYDSSNRISTSPSTEIPSDEFEVAPGQSEDKDLGVFIDLSKVKNPQPLRGSTSGPTDPGPR